MAMRLEAVRVGRVTPLGPEQVPSGYVKQTRVEPVTVSALGLMGDEQADLSVHGGPDKAVYGYAASHYATWRSEIPEHANLLVPGGMGENLTIAGVDEADLCIGDVHRIGTVTVQVCQPRQPCFKLAAYFGDAKMPRAFLRSGRSGWYYRVLETGKLCGGDDVQLLDRPQGFPFARLVAIVNGAAATAAEVAELARMPELASSLREGFVTSNRY
ncbi:MOSC domain-containing protein [Sphingomonas sp. PvP056]|uniref:MOSC domain-containing protein n=1 Tax=Sphingomonas sp. PvP056 TaxID=3156392 RepID=UPI0033944878